MAVVVVVAVLGARVAAANIAAEHLWGMATLVDPF